jgi:hypothetical protein
MFNCSSIRREISPEPGEKYCEARNSASEAEIDESRFDSKPARSQTEKDLSTFIGTVARNENVTNIAKRTEANLSKATG